MSNSPTSLIEYVKDRPGHDFRYATSFEKLKKLGWKPTNFFESSINEIIIGTRLIQTGFFMISTIY